MPAIWERCPGCDDYVCNLHGRHAYDCPCPDLDTFIDLGVDPYVDAVTNPVVGAVEGEAPLPPSDKEA
jgi:hypothetical protein